MSVWTVHLRDGKPAVLVPERFSIWAMLFGPLWLLLHGAWIPAVLVGSAEAVIAALAGEVARPVLLLGLAWLVGLAGQDMRRWSLARRRYRLAHVVAAADEDAALARLYAEHPDTAQGEWPASVAAP